MAAYLGHYSEHDDWATPEDAAKLQAILRGLGRDAEFMVYTGTEHAFFNDDRPESYDPAAAAVAWDRTVSFLRSQLG